MILRISKLIVAVTFLLFSFSFFSVGQVLAATQGDYSYIEVDGKITITDYLGSAKNVVIPSTLNGMPVTSIGERAFTSNQLTSVTIPDSVTTIGNYVFDNNPTTLKISRFNSETQYLYSMVDGKVTITDYVGAPDVVIPSTLNGMPVTSIGDSAFVGNNLTNVNIPNSVMTIGDSAFAGNNLTNVIIPNSVTSIGDSAFMDNNLTNVNIPNSVTSIGYNTFAANEIANVTIPNSVRSIGDNAFAVNNLTNVTIPNSVTSIGNGAFVYNKLTNVTIPNSITSLGIQVFALNNLTNVTIQDGLTSIGHHMFANNYLTNITIPNSVTSIGDYAFSANDLTNVTIPNSVTSIGYNAFAENNLTNVTIPNSVTAIHDYAFDINNLMNVTILNSVTSIGYQAFGSSRDTLKIIGFNPSTAKTYAGANNHLFEQISSISTPTTQDTGVISNQALTGTGSIGITVLNDDKKTPITEPLLVKIKDKSGRFVTIPSDTISTTDGTFTSSDKLAKGTYYVTISDGKIDQTTEVKVATKLVPIKLIWESTSEGLKDSKGAIKKSGAIAGIVYDSTTDTATSVANATVKVVSKKTTWSVKTDDKGRIKVYVPVGTYDVIINGKDSTNVDDKKNIIYKNIKVTAGQAAAPLEQLNAGLSWESGENNLDFVLTETSLIGKDTKTASKAFTGKAIADSTVSVYTVTSGDTVRTWIAETKTKKTDDFSVKVPILAGEQVIFTVQDEAGNVYESAIKQVPKIDAPTLSASASKGTVSGTTKITATKTKNSKNKILVIVSNAATSTPKLGDLAPTTSDSAILFVDNYESKKEISVKGATYAAVYEISPIGKVVKFKDVLLIDKIKE